MNLREQLIEKVQNLPDNYLAEVDKFLNKLEDDSQPNALAQLRKIRISATPDFSSKAEIYPAIEKDGK